MVKHMLVAGTIKRPTIEVCVPIPMCIIHCIDITKTHEITDLLESDWGGSVTLHLAFECGHLESLPLDSAIGASLFQAY